MPITVTEKWDSRPTNGGEQPSIELWFVIDGTDDNMAAHAAMVDYSPGLYQGLIRQSTHVERIAEYSWEGSVRYGLTEAKQAGQSQFVFDTGGGTQHVTQSLANVGRYGAPGTTAPDFQGAFGVSAEQVHGVDITVPVYLFSETNYFEDGVVTGTYKAALFGLTGTVNNGAFRGFATGEVLFLGASGSNRGQEPWEISFKFAASPNVPNLTVGNISGISKGGWEYLWVRYSDQEDTLAKVLVKRPLAAYVERVYPFGDFSGLGIGT
ncbi:MAG: hypothetical protein ACK6D3_22775 [Planctomycetaceae bacterium]